jgi:hypothetical protein
MTTGSMRMIGALLIASAVLALLSMAHHPHGSGRDATQFIVSLVALGPLARGVHASLIVLLWLQTWLLLESVLLDHGSRRNRLGAIAWSAGALLMTGAALISGFVAPTLAELVPPGDPQAAVSAQTLLRYSFVLNQVLAQAGLVFWAVAVAAWSLRLPARAAMPGDRWLGALAAYGVLAALVLLIGLSSGYLKLNVQGMQLGLLLLSLWLAGLGASLLAGRLRSNGKQVPDPNGPVGESMG